MSRSIMPVKHDNLYGRLHGLSKHTSSPHSSSFTSNTLDTLSPIQRASPFFCNVTHSARHLCYHSPVEHFHFLHYFLCYFNEFYKTIRLIIFHNKSFTPLEIDNNKYADVSTVFLQSSSGQKKKRKTKQNKTI